MNDLALVAPAGNGVDVDLTAGAADVTLVDHVRRVAIGDPLHVPAGQYAQQALETLGWWETLQPRLVPASDVRAALRLVELGEVDAGIVYVTDARRSGAVDVVGVFPAELHEPIVYPIARCSPRADGEAFIALLQSEVMTPVLEKAGFRAAAAGVGG